MDKYKIPNVKTFEYTKIIGIENIEFGKYAVRLDIKDSVFDKVMFLLKSLPKSEVKLRVEQNVTAENSDDIVSFFQNSPLKNEIKFGIESLENSEKKQKLLYWLEYDLFDRFSERIIDVDVDVMLKWGQMNALLKKKGKPMPIMCSTITSSTSSKIVFI